MIEQLRHISIFEAVIRLGSFRAAANDLKLSPSVVSYHITQLEKQVGTPLIYRTTRKLSLTSYGEILFEHASNIKNQTELALNKISHNIDHLAGQIKVTLPSALTHSPITKTLARFAIEYPMLSLDLSFSDVRQDIVAQGVDLAISAGKLKDSSLKSKRLGHISRRLVCAPSYLHKKAFANKPEDIMHWDWIQLAQIPKSRTIVNKTTQSQISLSVNPRLTVDTVEATTRFCLLGLGLATPPDYLVNQLIHEGTLVEVLPDWQVLPIDLYAVWPNNVSNQPLVKHLLEYLGRHDS